MSTWPTVPLGQAIELAYGKSLPKGIRVDDGKVPVYGSNGVAGWHDEALINGPTVIIGRKGSAGAVHYVDGPCYPIDTTYFVRARPAFDFDSRFLFYLLRQLDLSRLKTATGVPGLTREDAYRETIPVPPLHEQRRIVDLLSRTEGIVRLRREAQKKAAEIIPALFLDMFGDPATNPMGWPSALLPSVLARPFKNGLYLPRDRYVAEDEQGGVEMVHMSDAFYGEVKRGKLRRVRASDDVVRDYGLSPQDLLVARRSLNFDGAAKLCGIPASPDPLLFESSFIRLTPDESKVLTTYLLFYLNSESARRAYIIARISGITISGINQAALAQIPVCCPPTERQQQFAVRVEELRSIESQQEVATAKAEATFNALMARIFSDGGEQGA